MRLPDDFRPLRTASSFGLILALSACGFGPDQARPSTYGPALAVNGPQADYPVVVGSPYVVDGAAYTPEDVLNYDEVGHLALDAQGGTAITAAHHTLPLPSYVEVTSLETGHTILVRVERRGPMDGTQLLALSSGAMEQLEAQAGNAVRVRRVNPPEDQRAMLRTGQAAARPMDTPMPLVAVLKRNLPAIKPATIQAAPMLLENSVENLAQEPAPQPVDTPVVASETLPALPPLASVPASDGPDSTTPEFAAAFSVASPVGTALVQEAEGAFEVQAAAFSTATRARTAANALDGKVTQTGKFFHVRTGPFVTRSQAEASLAKVQAAGYKDARIFTNG